MCRFVIVNYYSLSLQQLIKPNIYITMTQKILNSDYRNYLKFCNFNDAQIDLVIEQVNIFNNSKVINVDIHERDLWYTMNQSGLFEEDRTNTAMIYRWCQADTREYITELPNHFFN